MKTCPRCSSTTFDDMLICYGCLQPFDDKPPLLAGPLPSGVGRNEDDDLFVEEPPELPAYTAGASSSVRFHVTIPELFGYDIYLRKTEGALLTVGCARDNNIVLPHSESRRHLLKLYYAQGQAWVEDKGSTQQALIEGIPLTGTRCLKQGATLEVGEARIELITE